MTLSRVIEALLFSAQKPLSIREMAAAIKAAGAEDPAAAGPNEFARASEAEIAAALEELKIEYIQEQRAFQIIEKAEVHELIHNPLHPYTRALLAAIPDPDPKNMSTFKNVPPGEPPSLLHPPAACRFHPRCPEFMKGLCDVQDPPDFEPRPGHYVLCWLYR